MTEFHRPIESPGDVLDDDEIDRMDPPATEAEMSDFEDGLDATRLAEARDAEDDEILLG